MTIETARPDPAVQALDAQASALMQRGIGLLHESRPDAARQALTCFDDALAIRRRLPIETVPRLKYGLAACWLNKADALMRLQDADQIVAAIHAFDEALMLLRRLPLGADPRYPRRLAIAHQNRGLALHAQGAPSLAAAITAFTDAIAVLEDETSEAVDDRQYLLAAVYVNLANVRAAEAAVESDGPARDAARQAIALVADLERSHVDAAEVGLRARHVVCQTLARNLSLSVGRLRDDVHDATDLVDDGLNLVRLWEQHGVDRFREIADDLFRFGARVYATYQPHFLDEFVAEHVDRSRGPAAGEAAG